MSAPSKIQHDDVAYEHRQPSHSDLAQQTVNGQLNFSIGSANPPWRYLRPSEDF